MLSAFIAGDDDIHIIPFPDGVDQLRDLFRRMLKIIIHGDDEISLRMRESTQKSRMLSEVSRHLDSVDHPGAQDIYTVKSPSGKEYMFPGVDAFLKERNPPEGYILVTPIPGLLDDDFDSERDGEE